MKLTIYYFIFSLFCRILNIVFLIPLDRIKELKKLNHSIVINFLELLDILIKSPSSPKVCLPLHSVKLHRFSGTHATYLKRSDQFRNC